MTLSHFFQRVLYSVLVFICTRTVLALARAFGWDPRGQASYVAKATKAIVRKCLLYFAAKRQQLRISLARLYYRSRRRFERPASPPEVANAPGLTWQRRHYGWFAVWRAPAEMVERGYRPAMQRLVCVGQELSRVEREYISDRCVRLQFDLIQHRQEFSA